MTYIAPNATVTGDVTLGEHVNIWYGAVLRGDSGSITVGEGTNIQDNAVCHCNHTMPVVIGDHVIVGHGAILHSCTVGSGTLVGIGSILMDGCKIGKGCKIAAGALVPPGMEVPDGHMVMGVPGKITRPIRPEEQEQMLQDAEHYYNLAVQQLPTVSP